VKISNALIQNTGTFTVQEQVGGAATFTNVVQTGTLGYGGIYNCGVAFTITDGGGNSGWNGTPVCVAQPTTFRYPATSRPAWSPARVHSVSARRPPAPLAQPRP